MAVGDDKVRTNITFPKDLKEKLEELAKQEDRSINYMVIKIIKEYFEGIQK